MKTFRLTDVNGKTLIEGSSVKIRNWAKKHNEIIKYSISSVNSRYFGEDLNKKVSLLECVNDTIKLNHKDHHYLGSAFHNGMELNVVVSN